MRHKLLVLTAAICILVLPALAGPTPVKPPAQGADTFPTTCPVNGDIIESASKAAGTSVYQGRTYYFCCERHKTEFDEDPSQYVKPAAPKATTK